MNRKACNSLISSPIGLQIWAAIGLEWLTAGLLDAKLLSQTVRIVLDSVYNTHSDFEGIITQTGLNKDVKFYPEQPRFETIEFNDLPGGGPRGSILKDIYFKGFANVRGWLRL